MGSPVAAKLVGYESSRYPALTFQQFAEEALSRSTVSAALDQDVDRIAVLIHGSPQVVALTLDRDEEFIQVPGVAQTTLPSFQGSSVSRAEFATPLPNRLVGDNDTALSQQILDVAEAEGEPVMPGKGTTSRSFPPLRTVRESFPSHRSSLSRACDLTRFLSSSVYLHIKSPSVRNRERTTPMD